MDPKWTQNGPKMDPKWTQNGPKMDPKWTQNGPKMDPKWTQNGPKMDPKWTRSLNTYKRIWSLTHMQARITHRHDLHSSCNIFWFLPKNSLIFSQNCNDVNPEKMFHSNSTSSLSILSKFLLNQISESNFSRMVTCKTRTRCQKIKRSLFDSP